MTLLEVIEKILTAILNRSENHEIRVEAIGLLGEVQLLSVE